ncbi:Bax inhibitor-1/YccA family protein [Bartonella sp. DGB2]|uniref:Bax inhibitor-1/YccA family protein n=1 Tax=Bartonella sp. DGB2 TaxID=3388426 RepID=UPI00398FDC70
MADYKNFRTSAATRADASIDQGLRSYMLGVYNTMAIGLVITAIAAYVLAAIATTTDSTEAVGTFANGVMLTRLGAAVYTSPLAYVIMFAPLVAVLFLSFKIQSLSTSSARTLFFVYAGLVGLSISSILLRYTSGSITQTFLITAASFGALSLYGYSTKRDLTGFGSFLFIGLFGIILASLVNLFLASSALQFTISVIGVLVFAGLTAYDTQKIKIMYYQEDSVENRGRKIIMGALALYLDFINMFIMLLQLMGQNRN